MVFFIFIGILLIWVIQRQWKMRKILTLSRILRNKYKALPLLGHGLQFLGTGEDRMNMFQNFAREAIKSKFGLTSMWLGPTYFALTCDPIVIGEVSKLSLAKPEIADLALNLLGSGSIISPEQSAVMVDCLKSRAGNGTFSIWNNIASYTMDSICQSALGIKMNAQAQSHHPFLLAFEKYSKLLSVRFVQPWLQWNLLYKLLPVCREENTYTKIMQDFVDKTIRDKRMLLKNENIATNINCTPGPTFLENLITSSGGSDGYSDLELREELLVLVLAGTDTSAVGISFATVMLSRQLDLQERAYKEVLEVFGDFKHAVTLEDLSRLKYVDAFIKETLRLYPPVPIILRENETDIQLTSGITLPTGSCCAFNIWGVHRNPQYWGADAEEFNPDRFLNGSVSPRSAFIPFSYGPRNCAGYQYAMMSMKVAVATLLRNFKVLPPSEISPEDLRKPLRVEFSLMLKDVDHFKVRLEQRSETMQ